MSNVIILTSGTSYAVQAESIGVAIPVRYCLPFYDPRFDPFILSAAQVPASACEPVSAVGIYGEPLYNVANLSASYSYTISNSRMLLSAAGQSGSSTLTGNPYNTTSFMNLLNGKPLSPMVSGSSMVYSAGSWSIAGFANVPVSGTLRNVSGYSNIRDIYHRVVSYSPIVSSDGTGVGRGVFKVRLSNQVGAFKFNKIVLYMSKFVNGVEDTSVDPVPAFVVALNRPVIKSTDGSNINYFEADVEVQLSASNYFGQIAYLNNTEWNYAGPGLINYFGKAALGSSAIPGSWEPRSRLHLYSEESVDHLRFSNENFDYISFDMGTVGSNRVSYILDTSASKTIDMRLRGHLSATGNVVVGGNVTVSGNLNVNDNFSVDPTGVVTVDNILYTENLEVYNAATFDTSISVAETSQFDQSIFVVDNLTATNLSAGETVYSKYTIASEILSGKVLQVTSNSQFEGDMRFIRDITNEISVLITSAGVISGGNIFGNSLNAANGANIGAFLYVGASSNSPSIFYRDVDFYRETTHGGNTRYTHGGTGMHTVLITSAGVISAGGGAGYIYGDYGFFKKDVVVEQDFYSYGTNFMEGDLYLGGGGHIAEIYSNNTFITGTGGSTGNLNVSGAVANHSSFRNRGHATFESEMRVSGTSVFKEGLSVSGVFHVAGNVNLDGGVLCNRTAIVTATGSGPYSAACGSASAGRISFSGGLSSDADITVNTTAVTANSVILVTPIRSDNGVGGISTDGTIVDGVSFQINFNSNSNSFRLDGVNFMIINRST